MNTNINFIPAYIHICGFLTYEYDSEHKPAKPPNFSQAAAAEKFPAKLKISRNLC